ncbi:hypothetical protein GGH16_001767, partial [Coemansia sp. RSA 560]
ITMMATFMPSMKCTCLGMALLVGCLMLSSQNQNMCLVQIPHQHPIMATCCTFHRLPGILSSSALLRQKRMCLMQFKDLAKNSLLS